MSTETLQPREWPRPKGYANGMSARGRMIFISGQVGWDDHGRFNSDILTEQVKQALDLQNIFNPGKILPAE